MPPAKIAAPADRDGRDARWDSHRAQRREDLVDATLRAIRRHGGSPSMDEIAEIAGTSKTVLYRYFDDQAGLYSAVAQRIDTTILERTLQTVNDIGDPHQRLAAMVSDYLDLLESDPEIYRFLEKKTLLDGRSVEYPTRELMSAISDVLSALFASNRDQPTTPMLMAGIISLMRTSADQWLQSRGTEHAVPRDEFARDLTAVLWSGASGIPR